MGLCLDSVQPGESAAGWLMRQLLRRRSSAAADTGQAEMPRVLMRSKQTALNDVLGLPVCFRKTPHLRRAVKAYSLDIRQNGNALYISV